jgi:ClpP class serine protease
MRRARFLQHGYLAIDASFFGIEFDVTEPAPFVQIGSSAVVEIRGPLTQHPCWFWDDYESIKGRAVEAFASSCESVVLKIDSPGGDAGGVFDLSRSLRKMAEKSGKKLYAYADGKALSAAYALACAADRIVLSETSSLGSIGCVATLFDVTAKDKKDGIAFAIVTSGQRKADGNPHVPLTEEALTACKGHVDAIAGVFFELVAGARKLSTGAIRSLEAAIFIGKDAESVGLADAVISFDDFIAELAPGAKTNAAKGGSEENMSIKAADGKDDDDKDKDKKEEKSEAAADDGKTCAKCDAANDADAKFCKKCGTKFAADDDEKTEEGDDKKKDAEADGGGLALAAKVQSLAVRLDAKEQAEERATLMASRPDFEPDVVKFLAGSSLETVRRAVKTFERRKPRGQIADARAAVGATVQATRGQGQGEETSAIREGYDLKELDVQMGLQPRTNQIKHEGNRMIFGVMTPEQAKAALAARAAEGKVT